MDAPLAADDDAIRKPLPGGCGISPKGVVRVSNCCTTSSITRKAINDHLRNRSETSQHLTSRFSPNWHLCGVFYRACCQCKCRLARDGALPEAFVARGTRNLRVFYDRARWYVPLNVPLTDLTLSRKWCHRVCRRIHDILAGIPRRPFSWE